MSVRIYLIRFTQARFQTDTHKHTRIGNITIAEYNTLLTVLRFNGPLALLPLYRYVPIFRYESIIFLLPNRQTTGPYIHTHIHRNSSVFIVLHIEHQYIAVGHNAKYINQIENIQLLVVRFFSSLFSLSLFLSSSVFLLFHSFFSSALTLSHYTLRGRSLSAVRFDFEFVTLVTQYTACHACAVYV